MASTDFDELAARSFDQPLDAEQQATLQVHGDALEQAGDPRGVLIALEYAIRREPRRRHAFARAGNEHLRARGKALLGPLAVLLDHARAVEFEWRSGRLHGVFVDVRRLPKDVDLTPADVIAHVCTSPAAQTLRRLQLRLRRVNDRYGVLSALCDPRRRRHLALEEIVVMNGVRPLTIGRPRDLDYIAGPSVDWEATYSLVQFYPRLRRLVLDEAIVPIPLAAPRTPVPHGTSPSDPGVRVQLGRQLANAPDHADAIARITALGPAAFMFVDTLLAMLEPAMPVSQPAIVRALAAIGGHARVALPRLATITGRPAHYDVATRRAAGEAITALTT